MTGVNRDLITELAGEITYTEVLLTDAAANRWRQTARRQRRVLGHLRAAYRHLECAVEIGDDVDDFDSDGNLI